MWQIIIYNYIKEINIPDGYTPSYKVNDYVFTVTNTDTNTAVVYEVDPNDGTFTYITDISEE